MSTPYGPYPPPPTWPTPRRGFSWLAFLGGVVVGVAVMAALWVVVAALNSSETTPTVQQIEQERSERKVFTTTRLEVGIRTILTEQYQIEGVESVSCPPAQDVVVGHTFQCVAVIHGEHRAVPIRVTSDEGHYEVGKPA